MDFNRITSVFFYVLLASAVVMASCNNSGRGSAEEKYGQAEDDFLRELDRIREPAAGLDNYTSLKAKALLQSAERFISNVESSFDKLNDEQWDKVEIRISEYQAEYKKLRDGLSQEEKDTFNRLMGNYLAMKAERAAKDIEENFQDAKSKAEGFLEKIKRND